MDLNRIVPANTVLFLTLKLDGITERVIMSTKPTDKIFREGLDLGLPHPTPLYKIKVLRLYSILIINVYLKYTLTFIFTFADYLQKRFILIKHLHSSISMD